MQRLLSLVSIVAACLVPAPTLAMGFGKVTGVTTLGHPLNFAIGLRLEGDETIDPQCVNAVVMSGDRVLTSDVVRAQLERLVSGERRIRVLTTVVIDEPVVQVSLHVGCPPGLSRSFTVFADPPSALAQAGEPLEAAEPLSFPTNPILSAATPGRGVAGGGADKPRARRPARELVAAAAPPAAGPATAGAARPRKRVQAPRVEARPVLQLDPVEADAMFDPPLRMATSLSLPDVASGASSSAAAFDPDVVARLREQERMRTLERTLTQLRDEGRRKDQALADLRSRARAAAVSRYDNRIVYGLLVLCGLLMVGVLWLLWWRQVERRRAGWWAAAEAEVIEETAAPPEFAAAAADSGTGPMKSLPGALADDPSRNDLDQGLTARSAPAMVPDPMRAPAPEQTLRSVVSGYSDSGLEQGLDEPRRPMSAEELIDLEQQVEFFVVLGQDEAAIDLLMGHVRSTGGVSPLPYLKLLEIYRRRNEQEPYERIRERFNRRFNGYAPGWEVDPEAGEALEDRPDVLAALQGIWGRPSASMDLLDDMLFRRDAVPTFEVPAYRELLFLYGIARDLAERDVPEAGVDLWLPLGEEAVVDRYPATPASIDLPRLDEPLSLDLDVSTDLQPALTVEFRRHADLDLDFTVDEDPSPDKPV